MTKQEALGYYDDFLEDIRETASDEVRETYQEIHDGFEAYLDAVQTDMFQQAFRYGYEKGLEQGKEYRDHGKRESIDL